MDKIFLRELKVETIIGFWEWERRIKQTVVLDVDMGTDTRRAAAADRIEDTVDYKAVAKRLIAFVGGSNFFFGGDAGGAHRRHSQQRVQGTVVPGAVEQAGGREVRTRCGCHHRAGHTVIA